MSVIDDVIDKAKADLQAINQKIQAAETRLAALHSAHDDLRNQIKPLQDEVTRQEAALRTAKEEAARVLTHAQETASSLVSVAQADSKRLRDAILSKIEAARQLFA
jgi:predicted  nucleic acid-binding Zn-ribbon protein